MGDNIIQYSIIQLYKRQQSNKQNCSQGRVQYLKTLQGVLKTQLCCAQQIFWFWQFGFVYDRIFSDFFFLLFLEGGINLAEDIVRLLGEEILQNQNAFCSCRYFKNFVLCIFIGQWFLLLDQSLFLTEDMNFGIYRSTIFPDQSMFSQQQHILLIFYIDLYSIQM
eukprot:TRINITY_DN3103_c0_g1_i13.p1 TRINITY_DN3103_c0_g1~~TRINITY_DN3103_c0_g1_i13.p1  ORF type:complete len:185 (-),score=4.77 TRINITY_DN3103_c0_g1_i13:257-751(-)